EKEYEPVRKYGTGIKKIITIGFVRNDPDAVSFEDLIKKGEAMYARDSHCERSAFAMPSENDLFTIIYTSGSTGIPKGVMLSHRNIISQIKSADLVYKLDGARDKAISSLPLSHIFERMVMYFYLSKGVSVYFVEDLNNIGALIREVKPDIMTVVPRLLEKIRDKMKEGAADYRGVKKVIASAALSFAERETSHNGGSLFKYLFFRFAVYSKLINALGGKFRYIISGAASLPADVGRFFLNIGFPLYEGYGLTEASPVIACNSKGHNKPGTVGRAFPGVAIKLNGNGEILAKGPNVMMGYLNSPAETSRVIDSDLFLHTGDLGTIDQKGYLKIVGRKKELFKKSTGEYVAPIPIEQALEKLDIVDIAVVIAEGRKFVSCILFPDFEVAEKLKIKSGFSRMSVDDFLKSESIRKKIESHITEMNSHLHHTEEVQKFTVITDRISIETGEITPTLKIRRTVIEKKFKNEIDAMYRD
ncbi:MAG TPA: AMP-binding protein, partial [Spirochaetota bacterium]